MYMQNHSYPYELKTIYGLSMTIRVLVIIWSSWCDQVCSKFTNIFCSFITMDDNTKILIECPWWISEIIIRHINILWMVFLPQQHSTTFHDVYISVYSYWFNKMKMVVTMKRKFIKYMLRYILYQLSAAISILSFGEYNGRSIQLLSISYIRL